jgi:hypothetical protein
MSLASLLDCHNIMATQRLFQDGSLAIGFNLGRKENEKVLHGVKNTSEGDVIIILTSRRQQESRVGSIPLKSG